MSNTWKKFHVCNPETTISCDFDKYCAPTTKESISPIDDLIAYVSTTLTIGTTKQLLENESLGRTLLLGLVSGAESYFRNILAKLIFLCPVCKRSSSTQMLSLSAVLYYNNEDIGFGLLEQTSFSSEGEIKKATKKFTGIEWKQNESIEIAISQFESLSHLRHASVHARGELSPRNVSAIGLSDSQQRQKVVIRFNELQMAGQIILNAARAYNRYMYMSILENWINGQILKGTWNSDKPLFTKLVHTFRSKSDNFGGPRYIANTYKALLPSVLSRNLSARQSATITQVTPPLASPHLPTNPPTPILLRETPPRSPTPPEA